LDIQDFGAIGELIGAAGVIVSLVYLARQIRQSNEQTKRGEVDAIQSEFASIRRLIYQSPDLSELMARGSESPKDLDPAEIDRFSALIDDFFLVGSQIKLKVEQGVLEQDIWEGVKPFYERIVSSPGGQLWWAHWTKTPFRGAFADEIAKMINVANKHHGDAED
jgi:hypothetical protein